MALRIPDVLRYEIRHRLERLGMGPGDGGARQWVNEHPGPALGLAGGSLILILFVLFLALRPASRVSVPQGRKVWFYDVNTGRLFPGSPEKTGPIAAPSGPASDGEPAGFRAHVYSYVPDPNDSELFTGFLERPDPDAASKPAATDMEDFERWARSRLIRRVQDKKWVWAASPEGQAILQELLQPNKQGQTPIYHTPRE